MITVYRSLDAADKNACEAIADLLRTEGLSPSVVDDEVRVPDEEAERAEQIVAEGTEIDPSDELDLEPIFHSEGSTTAEFEALEVKGVLEANGIAAVIVGDSVLPNLAFEVRVAHDQVEQAKQVLEEVQKTGPADAERAERESEV